MNRTINRFYFYALLTTVLGITVAGWWLGGIGVAPYMSIIDCLLAAGKKVTLLYGARRYGDLAFGVGLMKLVDRGLVVWPYVSETGKRLNPTLVDMLGQNATIYLCGPERLTQPFKQQLRTIGHPDRHIITEEFAY